VRDIRHETLLHLGQCGQPHNLLLQAVGHSVERTRERCDDIITALRYALLEFARSQLLRRLRGHPNRPDDETHDDPGDGANEQDEREPTEHQRRLHEAQCLLRIGQVVDQVELVLSR
jgi:hypothetical protein